MSDYQRLLDRLNDGMFHMHTAVNKQRNPVYLAREQANADQLAYVIEQYTIFPKNIISFLRTAQKRAEIEKWIAVVNDLERNIDQELGSETNGVPHYDMLVRGIKEGIGVDMHDTTANTATEAFIRRMRSSMESWSAPYVCGAVYAMESSAVPELEIVIDLTDELFRKMTGSDMGDGMLRDFFNGHLYSWEPTHESYLRDACGQYIKTGSQMFGFQHGFRGVMQKMDEWWSGLYDELQTR